MARQSVLVMVGDLPEPPGGVGQHCYSVCEVLAARGVRVHFLDTEPNAVKHRPALASYDVVTEHRARSVLAVLTSPRVVAQFARVVPRVGRALGLRGSVACLLMAARIARTTRAASASVIAAHHAGLRGLAALLAARATGARLTVFVHGAEWGHDDWRRLEPVTTFVAQQADTVIANSRYTAGLCTDATGRTAIDVIHPGVDHERFHPAPAARSKPDGLTVLFVGHLHPRKGPIVLARAIPLVLERQRETSTDEPPLRFVFAGPDRGEAAGVRAVIAEHGLDACVEIRGTVAASELPDLYRAADVVVFPTVWRTEGFGIVAAEAMACGVPVVASRIAAIPEVVDDGVTGLLFEPGDVGDLAEKLSALLGDEPQRRRMGAAGVERAQQFRWSAFAGVADATTPS